MLLFDKGYNYFLKLYENSIRYIVSEIQLNICERFQNNYIQYVCQFQECSFRNRASNKNTRIVC